MKKKTSLHELMKQVSFDVVFEQMTFLKERSSQIRLEVSALFESLLETKPKESCFHLHIIDRWEGCSPHIDMTCTIRDEEDEIRYIVEDFSSREELMGMEIWIEDDVQLSNEEIIAGLFWELNLL